MPELPEVETVRRTLAYQILGKTITDVAVYYTPMIENVGFDIFIEKLKSETFRKIERYGKYLLFILDHYTIISHLRMEGKYFLKSIDEPRNKHEHIVFTLDKQISFRYHDTRKFGKMALVASTDLDEIMRYPSLAKLGKEAIDPYFTKEELYSRLQHTQVAIKTALLNQEIICGMGNIYVDEVLFLSKIHPETIATCLTMEDTSHILENAQFVLEKAIQAGGTTIRSYTSSLGVTGLFQLELLVHQQAKNPCPVCQTTIQKIKVGGRGTYYCPLCQIKKRPKIIGITGSIATGKTTVTKYLRTLGYKVVDADEIVAEYKAVGKAIYCALTREYGRKILFDNEKIDDNQLAKIIFENEENRLKVNQMVHPIVQQKALQKIHSMNDSFVFFSVPLLFEAGFDTLCDQIVVVYADDEIQLERLIKRNHLSKEDAKRRIQTQLPQKEKCQKADYIIDNSRDLCYTIEQIHEMIKEVKQHYGN